MEEPTAETTGTAPETINNEPSQNPLEAELQRETNKGQRTEVEKAAFALKKNAERFQELGGDPALVLGIKKEDEAPVALDKSTPLTVEMYEQLEKNKGQQSALQLADAITDAKERELTKYNLQHKIVPTGDPREDLRTARLLANSVKNTQLVEELDRASVASTHGSGSGAPPKPLEKVQELTAQELQFAKMKKADGTPLMTHAEIIAARPK